MSDATSQVAWRGGHAMWHDWVSGSLRKWPEGPTRQGQEQGGAAQVGVRAKAQRTQGRVALPD
jgi:hypothetical protein